eukprot:5541919-Pleurochrysis_carterae.AAC.1
MLRQRRRWRRCVRCNWRTLRLTCRSVEAAAPIDSTQARPRTPQRRRQKRRRERRLRKLWQQGWRQRRRWQRQRRSRVRTRSAFERTALGAPQDQRVRAHSAMPRAR